MGGNTGSTPCLDIGSERPIVAEVTAPRVVDNIRDQSWVARFTGIEHPLESSVNPTIVRYAVIAEYLCRNPFWAGATPMAARSLLCATIVPIVCVP